MDLKPFSGFWGSLPKPFCVLAPMEDVTDWVFRTVLSCIAPPDVHFTEFAMSDRIAAGKKDALDRLCFDPLRHRPLVVQIWGTQPEEFRKAISYIRRLQPDGIDINMGCPQDSVTRKGAGSGHIRNPALAGEIILAAREACSASMDGLPALPLSIKTRMGWDRIQSGEWLSFLLSFRPAALCLHARTAVQQSEGEADWTQFGVLRELRDRISPGTLAVGNGDIRSAGDALEAVETWGLDGVMTGRGLFADPLVFRKMREAFGRPWTGEDEGFILPENQSLDFCELPESARARLALAHLDLYMDFWGKARNFEILKKYFKIYLCGTPGLLALREKLNACHDPDHTRSVIKEYLVSL